MARPSRCRRICEEPKSLRFSPETNQKAEPVILTVDEYEVIRLVDLEKLSHADCARQMEISRTTVTEIYEAARGKIADCIVGGKPLVISGGNYKLCDGNDAHYCHKRCNKKSYADISIPPKGEKIMRIAVTYENGEIFQHFGHTEQFKVYDVEDNKIVNSEVIDTNGSGHGALAGLLEELKADTLICGGIGGGAQMALAVAGIRLYGGVSGNADDAVNALLNKKLVFNPDVKCNHHGHEHGGGAHTCGEHGCGHGSCGNH